jgi:hypothetical protein
MDLSAFGRPLSWTGERSSLYESRFRMALLPFSIVEDRCKTLLHGDAGFAPLLNE